MKINEILYAAVDKNGVIAEASEGWILSASEESAAKMLRSRLKYFAGRKFKIVPVVIKHA